MATKTINTKIINKHDTQANWSKSSYVPLQGELIVFDTDANFDYERVKIGDGVHTINELPFIDDHKSLVQLINTIDADNAIENLPTLKIHRLSKEQYDEELAAGNIDENALYLTPEEEIDLSIYATKDQLNNKADKTHNHTINDITNLQDTLDNKVSTSTTINGKPLTSNISLSANDIGADVIGSANSALIQAKEYADNIANNMTTIQFITWDDDD